MGRYGPVYASELTIFARLDCSPAPPAGTLLGTTAAAARDGVAAFTDLAVNRSGTGYALAFFALAEGVLPASTEPFAVVAGPPRAIAVLVQPGSITAGQPLAPAPAVRILGAPTHAAPSESCRHNARFRMSPNDALSKVRRVVWQPAPRLCLLSPVYVPRLACCPA